VRVRSTVRLVANKIHDARCQCTPEVQSRRNYADLSRASFVAIVESRRRWNEATR